MAAKRSVASPFDVLGIPDRGAIEPETVMRLLDAARLVVDFPSSTCNLTHAEIAKLFWAWAYAERHAAAETARADKAERRERQFTDWWTGAKAQVEALQRQIAEMRE